MSETGNRQFLAGIGLNLPTLIQVVTLAAVIYAQWSVLDKQLSDNYDQDRGRDQRIDRLETKTNMMDRDQGKMEVKIESLRDLIMELRRQGGLQTEIPPR